MKISRWRTTLCSVLLFLFIFSSCGEDGAVLPACFECTYGDTGDDSPPYTRRYCVNDSTTWSQTSANWAAFIIRQKKVFKDSGGSCRDIFE